MSCAENETPSPARNWFFLLNIWCLVQTSLGLLLGACGALSALPVLGAEAVLLVSGSLFLRRCKMDRKLRLWPEATGNTQKIILGTLLGAAAILGWRMLSQPITEYDSLAYHLPILAKWHQLGSLRGCLEQFRDNAICGYPYGWEVLCGLCVMPFGDDFLIAFPNLIAWTLLGLGVYLSACAAGAKHLHGLMAAALIMLLPIMQEHVVSLHTDMPLATFFISGLYLAFSYQRARRIQHLALFLANLGMIAGTRTSGLAYGFLLALLLAGLLTADEREELAPSRAKISKAWMGLGVLGLLFLGGFWYCKNYLETGNPLGAVRLAFGDHVFFSQGRDFSRHYQTTLAHLFNVGSPAHWKILLGQMQVQLQAPFLFLAGLGFLAPAAFLKAKTSWQRSRLSGLAALLAATALLYWITPVSGDNGSQHGEITPWIGQGLRYAFPFIAVLAAVAAAAAGAAGMTEKAAILLVPAAATFCMPGSLLGALVLLARKTLFRNRLFLLGAAAILLFGCTLLARNVRAVRQEEAYGGIPQYLENHVGRNETIAYLLSHKSYPLYGKALDRKVVYMPSESEDWSAWRNSLRASGVGVIAVGPLLDKWKSRPELAWLNDKHGPFVRVYGDNNGASTVLYRYKENTSP